MFRAALLSVFAVASISFSRAFAQNGCDQARNPHSFACADATYAGAFFPQAQMTKAILVDGWTLLTYADVTGKQGPEFDVLVNPQNPRVPEGIRNRADGSGTGILDWGNQRIRMLNWITKGRTLTEQPGRTQFIDPTTIETHLTDGRETISFQCRMFLRNGNDHLLCRWFQAKNARYVFRGYMGFLRTR